METFVVRVWTPATGEPVTALKGTATHLRSGDEVSFSDSEILLGFFGQALSGADGDQAAGTYGQAGGT